MPHLRLTRRNASIFGSFILALVVPILCGLPLTAQDTSSDATTVRQAVGFAVSPPLRDLAKLPRAPRYAFHQTIPVRRIPKRDFGIAVDPVEQNTTSPSTNYSININILGVGNGFPGFTDAYSFPDANMAVGDTQIVQWVNESFAIFNKFNPAIVTGPIAGNLLFSALGGPCATINNDEEPIAQWDNAAHQWLLTQNVFVINGPHVETYACVAVSTTADATGTYYIYAFPLGSEILAFPKWGRWTDSWAQTMNLSTLLGFRGAKVCLYERASLLAGSPSPRQVCH